MYLKNLFAHLLSVVLYGQKLLCHLRFYTKGGWVTKGDSKSLKYEAGYEVVISKEKILFVGRKAMGWLGMGSEFVEDLRASWHLNKQLKLIRGSDANGATWGTSIAGGRASKGPKV